MSASEEGKGILEEYSVVGGKREWKSAVWLAEVDRAGLRISWGAGGPLGSLASRTHRHRLLGRPPPAGSSFLLHSEPITSRGNLMGN